MAKSNNISESINVDCLLGEVYSYLKIMSSENMTKTLESQLKQRLKKGRIDKKIAQAFLDPAGRKEELVYFPLYHIKAVYDRDEYQTTSTVSKNTSYHSIDDFDVELTTTTRDTSYSYSGTSGNTKSDVVFDKNLFAFNRTYIDDFVRIDTNSIGSNIKVYGAGWYLTEKQCKKRAKSMIGAGSYGSEKSGGKTVITLTDYDVSTLLIPVYRATKTINGTLFFSSSAL